MAAPGTLIPAYFFNSKDTSLKPHQTLIQNQVSDSIINMDNEPVALHSECKHNQLHMPSNINWVSGNHSGYEKTTASSAQDPWDVMLPVTAGCSASASCALTTQQQSDQTLSAGALSKQKEDMELLPDPQDNESKKIFSGLNPLRDIGSGKSSVALKRLDNRNKDFQRRREILAPVPSRSQQPLVIKNWSAFNDISNNKQYNFAEGVVPRRNTVDNAPSSSQVGWSATQHCNSNAVEHNKKSYVAPVRKYNNGTIVSSDVTTSSTSRERLDGSNMGATSDYDMIGTPSVNTGCMYGIGSVVEKGPCDDLEKGPMHSRSDSQLSVNADGFSLQVNENKENYGKPDHKQLYPDPRKSPPERFIGAPKQHSGSVSPSQVGSNRVGIVLEDVSECEILWEDLVIGERIGFGTLNFHLSSTVLSI